MTLRGTDPESYTTEHALVYEINVKSNRMSKANAFGRRRRLRPCCRRGASRGPTRLRAHPPASNLMSKAIECQKQSQSVMRTFSI